jgi:hypothetical protein
LGEEPYLRRVAELNTAADDLLRGAKSEAEITKIGEWINEERNALKTEVRRKGNMLVEAIAKAKRGAWDKPTYEMLKRGERALGKLPKTDLQIIKSGSRSNVKANTAAKCLRWGGRALYLVDVGIGVYNVVNAPEGAKLKTAAKEAARFTGALAGGLAGAKVGALAFVWAGPWGMGIAGIVGGVAGALAGGSAMEEVTDKILE